MKDLLLKHVKIGVGRTEIAKTGKGAAVGGVGAIAYSVISDLGYMPGALTSPDVVPYVVAGMAAAINAVRQFFTNHLE